MGRLGRVVDGLWGVTVVVLFVWGVVGLVGLDALLGWWACRGFWWVWFVLVPVVWVEVLLVLGLVVEWWGFVHEDDGVGGGV